MRGWTRRPTSASLKGRPSCPGWWAFPFFVLLVACEGTTVEVLPVHSLVLSPSSVQMTEGEEREISIELRGAGGEILGGREIEWESDSPGVVEVLAPGVIRGVAPGVGAVRVASEGVESEIHVTVEAMPLITLDRMDLSLSGVAGVEGVVEASIEIRNSGGGILSGLEAVPVDAGGIEGEPDWLSVELSASTAPTELLLRADPSELGAGVHSGGVEVRSPVAGNSPVVLSVRFEVREPPPQIALAPGSLSLAANAGSREPASQTVRVTNSGGGELTGLSVEVVLLDGAAAGWLQTTLGGSAAPTDLLLEALATNLSPGVYRAVVRVSAPGADPEEAEVEVTFNVGGSARDEILDLRPELR